MQGVIMVSLIALLVLALSHIDTASDKSGTISPFKVFSWPFVMMMAVQAVNIQFYGFTQMSVDFCSYIALHLIVFWIVCILFSSFLYKLEDEGTGPKRVEEEGHTRKLLLVIGVTASAVAVVNFFVNAKSVSVLGQVVQTEFQDQYGPSYWLKLITMVTSVYFLSRVDRKHLSDLIIGVFCLLPEILSFVKGVIFIPILGGIIGNILVHRRKVKLRHAALVIVSGIAVFYLVYLVEICIWNIDRLFDPATYSFIAAKLNVYLIDGLQCFNVVVSSGGGQQIDGGQGNIVFAPIINALAKFGIGERINTINNFFVTIGYIPGFGLAGGNTYTHIGESVLFCGLPLSLLVEAFYAALINALYVSYKNKADYLSLIAYSLFASMISLAWFDSYFSQTFWVYLLLIIGALKLVVTVLLASGASVIRVRRRHKIGDKGNRGDSGLLVNRKGVS